MQTKRVMANSNGIKSKKEQIKWKSHKLSPICLCIDSKNSFAYTGSKDGSIIKWCLTSRKIASKIGSGPSLENDESTDEQKHRHVRHINCIAISSDDRFLATGGWDKLIRIWSAESLDWVHTFKLHKGEITGLVFRQDHPTLYSGSSDRSVMLWTLEEDDNRCFIEALYGHESGITYMDCLRKEQILTAGGRDQTVRIWKVVDQAQTVFQSNHESVDVAKYIDDRTFITGGEDGKICIWTNLKRTPVLTLDNVHKLKDNDDGDLDDRCSRPQGRLWISSLAVHQIVGDKSGKATKKLRGDTESYVSGRESDGHDDEESGSDDNETLTSSKRNLLALVASGSSNGEIYVWKLFRSNGKYEMKIHQTLSCPGFINELRFTNDKKRLIAAHGQEHKFGRWWKLKKVKNGIRIFDLNALE